MSSSRLLFVYFLMCLCLFNSVLSIEPVPDIEKIQIEDIDEHTLEFNGLMPRDFILYLPPAHKLLVTIEHFNLYTEYGEYLLIKRGPNLEDEGTGIVLTGNETQGENLKPMLLSAETVLMRLHLDKSPRTGNTDITQKFIKLKYRAAGAAIIPSTTESPTTSSTWPTPGPHDKIFFKIFVSGRYNYEYRDPLMLYNLKTALKLMAIDYCDDNYLAVEPIKNENVLIQDLVRCPYSWPASDDCVSVNFAIPVVFVDNYEGYELLAKHLEVMWERYNFHLGKYDLRKYEMPDLNTNMLWWSLLLGILIGLIVLAIGTFMVIRECFPHILNKFIRKIEDDDVSPMVENEERESVISNLSQYNKFAESSDILYGATSNNLSVTRNSDNSISNC